MGEGKGAFGNIYDQFKGKVKEAFDFLLKHKSGDLLGVFHRDDVGDIDLVWGDKAKEQGLDHIIDKHIERYHDFANVEEAMAVIDDVINNGAVNEKKSRWDKVVLEKDGYMVVVSKNVRDGKGEIVNERKNWVVTAFDNNRTPKEKSSSDTTPVTPNINKGGRAVTPDEDLSTDKGTKKGKKSKPAEKKGGTGKKRGKKVHERRAEGAAAVSHSEAVLRDAVLGRLRESGMEVIEDEAEGQRVLDMANGKGVMLSAEKRRALETASLGETPRSLTVVSSADGAKVLKDVDNLVSEYENNATQPKTFIGDVARALGATRQGDTSAMITVDGSPYVIGEVDKNGIFPVAAGR